MPPPEEAKLRRKLEGEPIVLPLQYDPHALFFRGPIIVANLAVAESHRLALEKAGQPVPDPVSCRLLLDTGADLSVVKHELAERAGLKLISPSTPLRGVGVDTTGRIYFGRILFIIPSKRVEGAVHSFAVDAQIVSGTLGDSETIDGLIGRDVLRHAELTYNGPSGKVSLKFFR